MSETHYPTKTPKGAATSDPNDKEVLTYDASSNVTTIRTRANELIQFNYDALNRMTAKFGVPVNDVTYGYDNLGRLLTAKYSSGQGVTNVYDALGRLTSTATNVGGTARTLSHTYDLAGRRTKLSWWDGVYVDYDRLVTGELHKVRWNGATSGAGVLASYAYDDLGRRTSLTRGNGTVTSYGYDGVSRLASMTDNLAGTAHDQSVSFAYNPASQIVTRTGSNDIYAWTGHGSGSTASVVNGLNQLTSVGGSAASHDARGNLTGDPVTGGSYAYDTENRLTSATVGGATGTLSYDPLSRLDVYNPGTPSRFVYDGVEVAAVIDASGTIERRYVRGDGPDELIYQSVGPTHIPRWYHTDERGSIVAQTDGVGNAVVVNKYDEFGKPQPGNSGYYQYTGQMWLNDLGLYHYKARAYAPHLGRFLQPDPSGYEGGPNLYAYVLNDPVNLIDPLGLQCGGHGLYDALVCGERVRIDPGGAIGRTRGSPAPRDPRDDRGAEKTPQNNNCAAPGPRNILNRAIREAEARRTNDLRRINDAINRFGTKEAYPIIVGIQTRTMNWFISKVRTGGVWDFKNQPGTLGNRDFGNFAFGATAQALGYGDFGHVGADIYSLWENGTFEDQDALINAGQAYYDDGCQGG